MAKIVVVTSGKGGVGKTTTSASFASGLALRGHKTAVIDFDVGLRNLDLIMGCERRVVYDLINVIHGEANLNQALIKDKQSDSTLPTPSCVRARCCRTWPAWALNTSCAIRPPALKAAPSWPCTLPTRHCW